MNAGEDDDASGSASEVDFLEAMLESGARHDDDLGVLLGSGDDSESVDHIHEGLTGKSAAVKPVVSMPEAWNVGLGEQGAASASVLLNQELVSNVGSQLADGPLQGGHGRVRMLTDILRQALTPAIPKIFKRSSREWNSLPSVLDHWTLTLALDLQIFNCSGLAYLFAKLLLRR